MDILQRLERAFAPLVKPSPQELAHAIDQAQVTLEDLLPHAGEPGIYPYGRKPLFQPENVEILVMNWANHRECTPGALQSGT